MIWLLAFSEVGITVKLSVICTIQKNYKKKIPGINLARNNTTELRIQST
jgi:hypothetical protein